MRTFFCGKQVRALKKNTEKNQRTSRKEKLNAIMKKLEDGVKDLFTSDHYQNYLRNEERNLGL